MLMMDGSARFVSDWADMNVWHAMHSRESRDEPSELATAARSEGEPNGISAGGQLAACTVLGSSETFAERKAAKADKPPVAPSRTRPIPNPCPLPHQLPWHEVGADSGRRVRDGTAG